MLRTPERVRGVTSLSFEGLRARRTEIPMPMTNLVGVDGPDAVVPEASIEAVFEAFHDVPFGWLVGPNSPADLTTRLQDRGMTPFQSLAGLGLARISSTVSVPAGAHVREIGSDQREPFAELLAEAQLRLPPAWHGRVHVRLHFFAGPAGGPGACSAPGFLDTRDSAGVARRSSSHRLKAPPAWTRIKGESNVQGGGENGSVEGRGTGRGIGTDGGSPEGDWSPCRRRGGRGGLPGAGAAVERQPEARRGAAAAAWRIAGGAVP